MSTDSAAVRRRIKEILIERLHLEGMTPEMIGDETLLWGDELGLDSVDALELMVALEQEYGFRIDSEEVGQENLATVAALEKFVRGVEPTQAGAVAAAAKR
jgi:acyl carrier protein